MARDPNRFVLVDGVWRKSPEYHSWDMMRQRCDNPNFSSYEDYGAKGITYHPAWDDFDVFLRDVGKRPHPEMSLDRINGRGNYEPGNVRWATREEQQNNIATNRFVEYNGERLSFSQWSRRLGGNRNLVHLRIVQRGWDPITAVSTPARKRKSQDDNSGPSSLGGVPAGEVRDRMAA